MAQPQSASGGSAQTVIHAGVGVAEFPFADFFRQHEDRLGPQPDWAVLVIARVISGDGSLKGYLTVVDPKFGISANHKFASGQKNTVRKDETPRDTAKAELPEETGVEASDPQDPESLIFVGGEIHRSVKSPRGWHAKFLCVANVAERELAWLYNPEKNPGRSQPPVATRAKWRTSTRRRNSGSSSRTTNSFRTTRTCCAGTSAICVNLGFGRSRQHRMQTAETPTLRGLRGFSFLILESLLKHARTYFSQHAD